MHDLAKLVGAFAVSFAAVIVVALLFRIGGKKPNYLNIVAIQIGITIAEALRLAWPMSELLFPFVIGAAVGVLIFATQFIGTRRGV
jgi:hypothetical protein